MAIDWAFIESLEGKLVTHGYVPKDKNGVPIGRSGVTISTGVDLGQMRLTELTALLHDSMKYPDDLIRRLAPYLGLRREDAVDFLKEHPLEITEDEARLLSDGMYSRVLGDLASNWEHDTGVTFFKLHPAAQTVLLSLAWNFGSHLADVLPMTYRAFINAAATGEWENVCFILENFASKQPELAKRRFKEGQYLRKLTVVNEVT